MARRGFSKIPCNFLNEVEAIVQKQSESTKAAFKVFEWRSMYAITYMHPVMTMKVLERIKSNIGENCSVLEVGSGTCMLYALLTYMGLRVRPTDIARHETMYYYDELTHRIKVRDSNIDEIDSFEAAVKYKGDYDCLLCSWPFPGMIRNCLPVITCKYVVFIGEVPPHYICESREFFEEILQTYDIVDTIKLPNINWIDKGVCVIYKRKE